jgi:hypothetical protein
MGSTRPPHATTRWAWRSARAPASACGRRPHDRPRCASTTAATGAATEHAPLQRDPASGVWSATLAGDLSGNYYTYLVDVFVPGTGIVRNRVTDPYSIGLTTDPDAATSPTSTIRR